MENSIKYGIEKTGEPCIIKVKGYFNKKKIHVTISDNDPGVNAETIEKIQKGSIDGQIYGIGLKNINNRLAIIYKEDFTFLITSKTGKGTKIVIRLPVLEVKGFEEK